MKNRTKYRAIIILSFVCLIRSSDVAALPLWILSGAALGDASVWIYPASWAGTTLNLAHPDGDSFTVSDMTGSPDGVHIYVVDTVPSSTTGITGLGTNDRYFGVFVAGGTVPTYQVVYNYNGNPNINPGNENALLLFGRANNSGTTWTDLLATLNTIAKTQTKAGESSRGEYITGSGGVPLPIELLSFSAEWENENYSVVSLKWATILEVNNDHFEVERSLGGFNFIPILKIGGAGNSNTLLNYHIFDKDPCIYETSYYRLIQVDYNGAYSRSNILMVIPLKVIDMDREIVIIGIYPNPVKERLRYSVYSSKGGVVYVRIINVIGQNVTENKDWVNKGVNEKNRDVAFLRNGFYFLLIVAKYGKNMDIKEFNVVS